MARDIMFATSPVRAMKKVGIMDSNMMNKDKCIVIAQLDCHTQNIGIHNVHQNCASICPRSRILARDVILASYARDENDGHL
jgi:hypothetical protein